MKQRAELIQQIRAMESVPIAKTKFIDRTESSGRGLLAEMSVAEVHAITQVVMTWHTIKIQLYFCF